MAVVMGLGMGACVPADEMAESNAASNGSEDATASNATTRRMSADQPTAGSTAFALGREATAAEIAAMDIDVGPDGAGLPPGSASVEEGLAVYAARCAVCHGTDGTGGPNDQLAGRIPGDEFPFATEGGASTVGSYWPYATTLFDYIRRAMPFETPGSLTDEEVYASVAAILYLNDLVAADAVVDSATITDLVMPSRDRFVRDDREGGPEIR